MNKLLSVQYLRAFASLSVLFSHVLQEKSIMPFGNYFISGGYGVDLFFIISGFLIYLTTKDNDSWKKFAVKRVFRIFPLYWFVFILYLLYNYAVGNFNFSAVFYIQNLLMLPWDGPLTTESLLIHVAWSTVYEVYFYLIFTILLILKINKKYVIGLLVLFFVVVKGIFFLKINAINENNVFEFVNSIAGRTHIIPFIIGVVLAMIYNKPKIITTVISNRLLFKFIFILFNLIYLYILITQYSQYKSYLISTIIFCLWIYIDLIYKINYENRISKFFIMVGNVSYSIYLLHILVIIIIVKFMHIDNLYFLNLLTLLFTISLSYLTYTYIEKPFIDIAKKIIDLRVDKSKK